MNKTLKTCAALMLALTIMLSLALPAYAADTDLDAVIEDVAAILQEKVKSPGIAQTGGDWTIIALRRSGVTVPDEYYQLYYNNAADFIAKRDGVLSTTKFSEYSRVALSMTALGLDANRVAGYSLLYPLQSDYSGTTTQGINGPIFALISFAAAGYREDDICAPYVEYILSKQLTDGGFAMSGEISDPDTTALALTALSGYTDRVDVSEAIEAGVMRLSRLQRDTGGYTSYSHINSESVSQVIVALSTLGIHIDDARFVKNGNTLLDNLMTYYIPGEGFEHEDGQGADLMSTEQALLALAAIYRQREGLAALYDMRDTQAISLTAPGEGLPGKRSYIAVPDVTIPDASFDDINGIPEENAILALARRGIVEGYPGSGFAPDRTLTRAEFAAIVVRALSLKYPGGSQNLPFRDVSPDAWYFEPLLAAYNRIILGRGDAIMDPNGTLTRQEAAVMIARAAGLCGMDTEYSSDAARSVLSQFTDYRKTAEWATGAMAFCYDNNLLDQSDIESRPDDDILRREMAELTYRLLVTARLVEPAGEQ